MFSIYVNDKKKKTLKVKKTGGLIGMINYANQLSDNYEPSKMLLGGYNL